MQHNPRHHPPHTIKSNDEPIKYLYIELYIYISSTPWTCAKRARWGRNHGLSSSSFQSSFSRHPRVSKRIKFTPRKMFPTVWLHDVYPPQSPRVGFLLRVCACNYTTTLCLELSTIYILYNTYIQLGEYLSIYTCM